MEEIFTALIQAVTQMPPQAQAFGILFAFVGVAFYLLLYVFLAKQKEPSSLSRSDLGAIGMAFGNDDRTRDELKEIRQTIKDAAANTAKTNDLAAATNVLLSAIATNLKAVAQAINNQGKVRARR